MRRFLPLLAVLAVGLAVLVGPEAGSAKAPPKKTTTTRAATTTTSSPTSTTLAATTTTEAMPTTTTIVMGGGWGPQPITQPGGSTSVAPGGSIATAITTAGAGGTVWLQAGLHRLAAPITPLANQTILGEQGAIVDGSVLISGSWTTSGSQVWAAAQLPATANATGVCQGGGTLCQPTEDVFLDGVKLTRVANQAAVVSGTFWGDYPNNRIYLAAADSPATRTVEQAKTAAMIGNSQGVNGGVTIRNLEIRRFANPYQNAAVTANHGGGSSTNFWTIQHCRIRQNHADGAKSYAHWTRFVRNILEENGSLGMSAFGNDRVSVERNIVRGNNTNGFDTGWEAGGMKLATVDDIRVWGNEVYSNIGTGIWLDIDSRRAEILENDVYSNETGIYYEISFDGTIRANRVANNTTEGIFWNASARGSVTFNTLIGNGTDLRFAADPNRDTSDPSAFEPHTLAGVACADNTVDHPAASGYGAGIWLFNTVDTSYFNAVTFNRNTYRIDNTASNRFWLNQNRTFAQWQAAGKDTDGSVST